MAANQSTGKGIATNARRLAGFLLAAASLTFAPTYASAIDLFGKSFFESKKTDETEETVPDPTPYTVQLTVADGIGDGQDKLASELEETSLLLSGKDNPPSGLIGVISRARSDRTLLLAALYDNGRYGGTIDIKVAGRDVDEIGLDPDHKASLPVPVEVIVRPGPVFRFGALKITLAGGGTENPADYDLVSGQVAQSNLILAAEARLVRVFQERGRPFAKLVDQNVIADHENATLDVEFFFDPGPIATFGSVRVEGTEKVEPDFVIKHADVPVGHTYDPRKLEKSGDRLRKLGIFSRVTVEASREIAPDGTVPVLITVAEGKMRVIGAGLTVDSENGLGIEGFWRHRNVFGRGEQFGVEVAVGRIGEVTNLEQLEYKASLFFVKPGIIGPASTFDSRISFEFEDSDAFKRTAATAEAGISYEIDEKQSVRGGIEFELSEIEDTFGTSEHILLGTPFEYIRDARDDILDPTKGYRAVLFAEPFYDFRQSVGFVRLGGTLTAYQAVDAAKRFVLAAKAGGGIILGADIANIAANRRFFAGGATSVRGYGFQQAGPAAADGTPTGGLALVETSVEARVRVTKTISVVPFFDAGGVFDNSSADFGDSLQFGAGVGVRYKTPIGPLRLDVAVPLNPGRGDDKFGVYLGLGHAF